MATHSSILACSIPWAEKPGRLQSMGSQESDTTQRLNHQPLVTEGVQAESLGGQPKTTKQVGTALGVSPPQTGSLL